MVENKSKTSEIKKMLRKENINISSKELKDLIFSFNKWQMPVTQRLQKILDDKEPFINFVKMIKNK